MRAREFVINVPITIKINGDGDPEIDMTGSNEPKDPKELDPNPTFVPPLQQDIELKKASVGKDSPVIQDLVQDEDEPEESEPRFPFAEATTQDYIDALNSHKKKPKGKPLSKEEEKKLVHIPGYGRVTPDQAKKIQST